MVAKVVPFSRSSVATTKPKSRFANFRQDIVPEPVAKGEQPSKEWFVRGPFPGKQFEIAARLPGKALLVWELVHHQCRLRRNKEIAVTLPADLCSRVGLKPDARLCALRHLEKAGLTAVTWEIGHSPLIRLVEE